MARTRLFSNTDIVHLLTKLNGLDIITEIFRQKARGLTVIADEATLYWQTTVGSVARSIAMPGAFPTQDLYGTKIINSSLANVDSRLARASGVVLLFDRETAAISAILDAARISAVRTALVSMVGARLLARTGPMRLGVIGLGPIGMAHIEVFTKHCALLSLALYDLSEIACQVAIAEIANRGWYSGSIEVSSGPNELLAKSDCVITATTVTAPYIYATALSPGQTLVNVSLDDLADDVFLTADQVWVDDVDLVIKDRRRCLGRLIDSSEPVSGIDDKSTVSFSGSIDSLVLSQEPGRRDDNEIIVFNPFGMSIMDVGLAACIVTIATDDVGTMIDLGV